MENLKHYVSQGMNLIPMAINPLSYAETVPGAVAASVGLSSVASIATYLLTNGFVGAWYKPNQAAYAVLYLGMAAGAGYAKKWQLDYVQRQREHQDRLEAARLEREWSLFKTKDNFSSYIFHGCGVALFVSTPMGWGGLAGLSAAGVCGAAVGKIWLWSNPPKFG